ncbi:MAG: hypothetical protein R3F29_13040 [Planctomycetota bacterium]
MTGPLPLRLALTALAAAVAACSSAPPQPPAPNRPHLHTATVSITGEALLPAAKVSVPAMSTVVFRNRTAQPFAVDIDQVVCQRCDTVLGFEPAGGGARCDTGAAHGVATLCFHDPGTFPFVVTVGDRTFDGIVEVTQ